MRRRRSSDADDSAIDLTPMLDIVFIMLIFFIVTATFVRERGIDVLRPDPNQDQQTAQRVVPIRVIITDANEVQVIDERTQQPRTIDRRAVRANIERLRVDNQDGPVLIQAAAEADMGVTVTVLDQARQAGAPSVTIEAAAIE